MTPQEVKHRVVDNDIWENAVWVNQHEQLFFVPIWRNGNTTFMNDVAEQFNFTLEKDVDLANYTGFTLLRDPAKRLTGQLWRACVNNNYELDYVVTNLLKQNEVDIHLATQTSFLKSYMIKYYLDLDNLTYTNHQLTDSIIDVFKTPKEIKDNQKSDQFAKELDSYFETNNVAKLLEQYYIDDFELYHRVISQENK
jgi:hypothetical protein